MGSGQRTLPVLRRIQGQATLQAHARMARRSNNAAVDGVPLRGATANPGDPHVVSASRHRHTGGHRVKLPQLLVNTDDARALEVLSCYYGIGPHADHNGFTGAWFDTWDSSGTRARSANQFTADDLVAVTFLSVDVPPWAALEILDRKAVVLSALLAELGPDRDLVEERDTWPEDWAGWRLWSELTNLPGVGPTTASKLIARKRPALRPIYDGVVAAVVESAQLWEPLRARLQDQPELHPRLIKLRDQLALPEQVSALRVFDVLAWMEGTGRAACTWVRPTV